MRGKGKDWIGLDWIGQIETEGRNREEVEGKTPDGGYYCYADITSCLC